MQNFHSGGDHQMARNGPISQYTAGWDWIRGTPDRNTGLWDDISLRQTGPVALGDVHVSTQAICHLPVFGDSVSGTEAKPTDGERTGLNDALCRGAIGPQAHLGVAVELWVGDAAGTGAAAQGSHAREEILVVVVVTDVSSGGEGVIVGSVNITADTGGAVNGTVSVSGNITITDPILWWPATMGAPFLYNVTIAVLLVATGEVSDMQIMRYGIRQVRSHLDRGRAAQTGHGIAGRIFVVNGRRIFLQGGNWITTDQFQR